MSVQVVPMPEWAKGHRCGTGGMLTGHWYQGCKDLGKGDLHVQLTTTPTGELMNQRAWTEPPKPAPTNSSTQTSDSAEEREPSDPAKSGGGGGEEE